MTARLSFQCHRVCSSLLLAMLCLGLVPGRHAARAESPQIRFDVGRMIPCRDVTTGEFAAVNPHEKVVEAIFRVSVLFQKGELDDIEELIVTIVSPKRRLRVVDFSPKDQRTSEFAGPIETVETNETESSLTASVGGSVGGGLGPLNVHLAPTAGSGKVQRNVSQETFQRRPSPQIVLTSGTTNSEFGVFFKLRPSPRQPLEGMRQFTCRFAVPETWRGDWALITCVARGYRRHLFTKRLAELGRVVVPTGLYLEGDLQAKQRALALARGEDTAHMGSVQRRVCGYGGPANGNVFGTEPTQRSGEKRKGCWSTDVDAARRQAAPTTASLEALFRSKTRPIAPTDDATTRRSVDAPRL